MTGSFDYASLKELLKDTNAEVLLPTDGEAYEKSIQRWSEHCMKRAVSLPENKVLFLVPQCGHGLVLLSQNYYLRVECTLTYV
jgi:hypothetical protein